MAKIKNNNTIILFTVLLVILGIYVFYSDKLSQIQKDSQNINTTANNCLADDCLLVDGLEFPVSTLPNDVVSAMDKAINDEYAAYSTYDAIIRKFGSVRPFSMIVNAEDQHIAMLKAIYNKYGLKVPTNKLLGNVKAPTSLKEACQIGVDAEIKNGALYNDELIPAVKNYEDITLVFTNLMNASIQKHLPAFEKCN